MTLDSKSLERIISDISLSHSITNVLEIDVKLAVSSKVKDRHNGKELVDSGIITLIPNTLNFSHTL